MYAASNTVTDDSVERLLNAGAHVNIKNRNGQTALSLCAAGDDDRNREQKMRILIAAGEILDDRTRSWLQPPDAIPHEYNLMSLCREAIRKHLRDIDPHANHVYTVAQLGLFDDLEKYLLYKGPLHFRVPVS